MSNSEMGNFLTDICIRPIAESDDPLIAEIIRGNLKKFHLDIPGTVYFDPEVDHLSEYYNVLPDKRRYFIVVDREGQILGGCGVAEYDGFDRCAELQKLYLTDAAKGKGISKYLVQAVEDFARETGYKIMYLETHTNLETAIRLYEKVGYRQIDRPESVQHGPMNRFYLKEL